MSEEEYIETIQINDYFELQDIMQGRNDYADFRDDFIYRGINKKCYELIPSSLRNNNILDYIGLDYNPPFSLKKESAIRLGLNIKDKTPDNKGLYKFKINKYDEFENGVKVDNEFYLNQFKLGKEMYVLFNFIFYADKYGLKVPISANVRKQSLKSIIDIPQTWPQEEYFEIISLAQHYDLPTRALDWSYDYKVSLYFAVRNVLYDKFSLDNEDNDGVLWAFNYGYFKSDNTNNDFKVQFYRPEYYSNPNLNAQNGLFTFVIDYDQECDERPLNEIIISELENNCWIINNEPVYDIKGLEKFSIPENEKIFYKFIIPRDIKAEVLKQLYTDGYSEERLFPGYAGVTEYIKNKAKLDEILDQNKLI
ncbi:MAG: FRG domain-containing protein [Methanobrevibacter thaueri]|nr:FRG domain-containing protein [Methanobrevibacter thaueri]